MNDRTTARLLMALWSAGLLLMAACGSSAEVTATLTGESEPIDQPSNVSVPADEVRLNGAPLANKMGVCDAYDAAFIGQWVGIEESGYTSFGAQSDGCTWYGDNWDTTHRVAKIDVIIFSEQAYEAKTAKFAPFVGGPAGSFIHNDVHVYLEHEGKHVGFVIIPTREEATESALPADNVEIYTEVINALLPQLAGIAEA